MATLANVTISDTGYAQLPVGTTAQRPAGVIGMVRFNSDTRVVECYTAAGWVAYDDQQTATGGTVTSASGYTVHTFTSSGTFTPTYTGPVDVLVVAGGGGGAAGIGGGGGAGGLIYNQGVLVTSSTPYAITVGPGGIQGPGSPWTGLGAPPGHGPDGLKGADSSAFGITATGGGGGGGYYATHQNSNQLGGSGGGGPGYGTASGPWGGNSGFRPGPPGISGQGHPGGFGYHGNPHGGGGGGGAGEPGYCRGGNNPTSQIDTGPGAWNSTTEHIGLQMAGNASGGNGMSVGIAGAPTYYAGGGGGGVHSAGSYGFGRTSGGLGGGGHSPGSSPGNGNPATYYGGGGGAGNHPDPSSGGYGYQGIVIVRYKSS